MSEAASAPGAPVMAGLIAAAVGGIVAGSLGGSPLQVSGPAAGLAVIVYELVRRWEIRLQQRSVAAELATGRDLAREGSAS